MLSLTDARFTRAEDLAEHGPERVFVLAAANGELELYESPTGDLVVWAYTTIQDLVASCGGGQPWLAVPVADLARIAAEVPLLVALDVWHPDGARYPEPDVREREPLAPLEPPLDAATVWLPVRRVPGADGRVEVELYAVTPSEPLLPVYTTVAALRAGCGPQQAAVAISPVDVDEVVTATGARGVVLDATLAEEARHQAPVVDWTRPDTVGSERHG